MLAICLSPFIPSFCLSVSLLLFILSLLFPTITFTYCAQLHFSISPNYLVLFYPIIFSYFPNYAFQFCLITLFTLPNHICTFRLFSIYLFYLINFFVAHLCSIISSFLIPLFHQVTLFYAQLHYLLAHLHYFSLNYTVILHN